MIDFLSQIYVTTQSLVFSSITLNQSRVNFEIAVLIYAIGILSIANALTFIFKFLRERTLTYIRV